MWCTDSLCLVETPCIQIKIDEFGEQINDGRVKKNKIT